MLIVTKGSQLKMKFNLIVHKCDTSETSCNCIPMKFVLLLKYFEVTIDFDLKMSEQICMKKKMRNLIVLFYKIRFLNKLDKMRIYDSIV